jgi:hypothetical protein
VHGRQVVRVDRDVDPPRDGIERQFALGPRRIDDQAAMTGYVWSAYGARPPRRNGLT